MSKELNKALDLLREIRPSIPKDVLELWCKDRDAFLAQRSEFHQHLKECADEVATWPTYKREALGPFLGHELGIEGETETANELNKAPVEQAGGDERAAQWHECTCPKIGEKWNPAKHGKDCPVHQARAALAQPSPAQADEKPGDRILCYGCFAKGVGPEHFDEAGKCLVRQQLDPLGLAQHAKAFNEVHAEALRPEQAEAERPEVVAVVRAQGFGRVCEADANTLYQHCSDGDELMTVAQHERIVGALRAENAKLSEALDRWPLIRDSLKLRLADALSRVAELEMLLRKLSTNGLMQFSTVDEEMAVQAALGGAPVAQAQQLNDLDKQCRDDVARALGLRPNQERGFAWSYLLASIKSCVKASGDSAQAQHSA
ncbi:hypothetical protein ACM7JD_31770, partial [Pseudomonas aeruginosa]